MADASELSVLPIELLASKAASSVTSTEPPDIKAPTDPVVPTIKGRAINGYLVNALVFQDANKDGLLSVNENMALTDANGQFSLPGSSRGDLIVKPINLLSDAEKVDGQSQLRAVGLVNPDVLSTYYVTATGARKDFRGQLEMSASMVGEEVNITPLTTLVSGLVNSGQFDLTRANQKVESLFGMPSTTDYVAMSTATSPQQMREGIVLQGKAVALSNLLSGTLAFFDDSLSHQALLEMLALKVTQRLEEFAASPMANVDIASYLASSADIKAILLDIGQDNDLEVNLSLLASAVESLVSLNTPFVDGSVVRLAQDTGVSGIDHITSNWRLALPELDAAQSHVYGVAHQLVAQDGAWLPSSWSTSIEDLDISQGMNTVFIKSQGVANTEVRRLAFYYDNQAPGLAINSAANPIETWVSPYFLSDSNAYTAEVKLIETFMRSDESGQGLLLPQYQLVRADAEGALSGANAGGWLSFPNISTRSVINGLDMRLYFRQMDLAGNVSEASHFDFIYDNVKPQALLIEDVSLQFDTGIYGYDKYTSNLNLDELESRFSTLFDEATVITLGQWVPAGRQVDPDLFEAQPDAPRIDGHYGFVAVQADRAGNFSDALKLEYVLDTHAPDRALASGLQLDNGHALPVLTYDRSQDSMTEWVQYRMVDTSLPTAQQNESPWLNINTVTQSGSYDVYYRFVDRAGNATLARHAGAVTLDESAPLVVVQGEQALAQLSSSEVLAWLKNNAAVQGDLSTQPKIAVQTISPHAEISLSDFHVIAEDVYRNVSSPWAFTSLKDDVFRRTVNVDDRSGYVLQAVEHEATDFVLNTSADSLIALGSDRSDKVRALDVGDIFIGLGGGDLAVIDDALELTGLAFLNESETQFFLDSFEDVLTADQAQRLVATPILKAYLEDANDPNAGGIAIFQSQFTQYASGLSTEYLLTQWNPNFDKWFVDLGANDDKVYFGGDAMNVLGGAGSDLLQGGAGDDFIVGGPGTVNGSDILRGFAGNDTLVGGDYLFFSHGSAILEGGSGDDTLIAGNGRMQLKGDAGADLFVIAPIDDSSAPLQVEILDFSPGTDFLNLVGLQKDAVMKGIFIDQANGHVQIDLVSLLGPENSPFGSVVTLLGVGLDGLLPETIAEQWFDYTESDAFQWSDLSIEAINWS